MQQQIRRESPNRQYVTLSAAFDFFNRTLFEGKLPLALITMQRHAGARGYYSAKRFEGRGGRGRETDEIALNPATFKGRTDAEILSTLVHEMAHHWQAHRGNPGRGRYHNEEWAAKMEWLGLMPSDTGLPGGKRVGQQVTHYILAGGRFEKACKELLADGARVEWQSREDERQAAARSVKNRSKSKYTCPGCGVNAWAKPGVHLLCGDCEEELEAEGES